MKPISLRTSFLMLLFLGCVTTSMAQRSSETLDDKRDKRKNLTITEYNTDAKGQNKWKDHVTVYNAKGLKVQEIEFATYGMREKVTFEYDSQDRCVKEIVYDDRNKVSRIRKYEYNADGTKKTQYNYLPNGRLYSTKVYQYSN